MTRPLSNLTRPLALALSALLPPLLTTACADPDEGAGSADAGGVVDAGAGMPTADAGGDAGGAGGGGGGGAAAATPCGLAADHELVFALTAAGWTQESQAAGGRTLWRATAPAAGRTGPIAPGQTVSVTVTLDPPLTMTRDAGTATLRLIPVRGARGDHHAIYQQQVNSEGTLTFGGAPGGDWRLTDDLRADAVVLTALAINPVAGETLSCLSSRVSFNPIGFSASDNRPVDTRPGGTVAFEGVEIEVSDGTGELPLEPFAFTFGE